MRPSTAIYSPTMRTGETAVIDPGFFSALSLPPSGRPVQKILRPSLLTHGHLRPHRRPGTGTPDDRRQNLYWQRGRRISSRPCAQPVQQAVRRSTACHYPGRPISEGDVTRWAALIHSALHTPGATPAGSYCHLGDALFSGDTLFQQSCGRTGFPHRRFRRDGRICARLADLLAYLQVLPRARGGTTLWIREAKVFNPYMQNN